MIDPENLRKLELLIDQCLQAHSIFFCHFLHNRLLFVLPRLYLLFLVKCS